MQMTGYEQKQALLKLGLKLPLDKAVKIVQRLHDGEGKNAIGNGETWDSKIAPDPRTIWKIADLYQKGELNFLLPAKSDETKHKEMVQSHVDTVLRGAWVVENALRELTFAVNGDCLVKVVNDLLGKRWPIPGDIWGSWERGGGEVPDLLPMLQSFGQHFPALAEDVQGWLAQVDRRETERMGASHDGTRDVLLEASNVLARTLLDARLRGRLPVGSACQWC